MLLIVLERFTLLQSCGRVQNTKVESYRIALTERKSKRLGIYRRRFYLDDRGTDDALKLVVELGKGRKMEKFLRKVQETKLESTRKSSIVSLSG